MDGRCVVRVGVCAMPKKVRSEPMQRILGELTSSRLARFCPVVFDARTLFEVPVEEWPLCDALIAFHSEGFPLERAAAYAELRRPYCLNSLGEQRTLLDRAAVYEVLVRHGVPVPPHVVVHHRDGPGDDISFVEHDDFIEHDGVRLYKPFVEKPVDAEDHRVCIYYAKPLYGCRRLFRKTANLSSVFDPECRRVRRQGSFIYERFIPSEQQSDIKVYAVGPDYAYAERRKSPVVDGIVERNPAGKEVRFPVELTPAERWIAARITTAFRQFVCGFDLIRHADGGSVYVNDVNGFSFVKGSEAYYRSCGRILAEHLARECLHRSRLANGQSDG
jgi:inositol hexakisphosphate/diphosphoinositol-pentakisphosphate kinase